MMGGNMFDGLGTLLITFFIGSILFVITGVYCIYLVYQQHYGTSIYESKTLVVPERKIISTNTNGVVVTDTTYYYKFTR
jgi:hypothetical protein